MGMMLTFKRVIQDYITPNGISLQRDLTQRISRQVDFLSKARSLAASMKTGIRFIKTEVNKFPIDIPDSDARAALCETIDDFIRDRITFAGQAINTLLFNAGKIKNGDVIMVYARSSVVIGLLKEAVAKGFQFQVVVIDSRPFLEGFILLLFLGKETLKELVKAGIQCEYGYTHSIPALLKGVTKVIIGASSVMTNGDIMGRIGTAVVCMAAYTANLPVIVLCETYKFSDNLVRLDSFVWNEHGILYFHDR
jgi:translation initiation factor eIF-2B subunit delta